MPACIGKDAEPVWRAGPATCAAGVSGLRDVQLARMLTAGRLAGERRIGACWARAVV